MPLLGSSPVFSGLSRRLERLASRPIPPLWVRLALSVALTAAFGLIRLVVESLLGDVVGFNILLPAVLLAGLAGGTLSSVITVALCIATMYGLRDVLPSLAIPDDRFAISAILFGIVGLLTGLIAASLRHSLRHLFETQTRLYQLMNAQRMTTSQLRSMIDQASVGIVYSDLDGNILEANARFRELIGKSVDQTTLFDHTHPDDVEASREALKRGEGEPASWQFTKRYLRADGTVIHALVECQSMKRDEDNVMGVLSVIVDMTATRKAEAALSESRRLFRNVADSIPILVWLTDKDNKGRFINRAFVEFVGKPAEEVTFNDWLTLLHPDDYDRALATYKQGVASGVTFSLLARYRRHDGQWRWLRSIHQPRLDSNGQADGYIGSAFDITESHESASRLQESENRFRTIADSAPAIIWMVDAHGNTEFGNRRFRSLFTGQPPERLLTAIREMTSPEDLPAFDEVLQSAYRNNRRFTYTGRINHPVYGRRWLRTDGAPRYDIQGNLIGFTGVSTDVTESHRAERDLKRINELLEERVNAALAEKAKAEAELVRAHRLEAIGRLTGGVAHDFNNLLTVIMGGLEIIRKTDDPSRRQKMVEAALAAARRGERLTGQLLAFSRRQTLHPSSTDINALMREGEPLLQQAVGDGRTLTLHLKDGPASTLVDAAKFEAALINLLVNARDASEPDGLISVETDEYICPPASAQPSHNLHDPIHPQDLLPGRYIRVTVADNGSGMSEEVQKRVFEPFFTTKGIGHGTGLGLSQVYGFTRQSGGSISIQSEVGKGTRINMFLPWVSPDTLLVPGAPDETGQPGEANVIREIAPVDAPPKSASLTERPLRLLLVEDDEAVATFASSVLQTDTIQVERVSSARTALERLSKERYDVLLSDILMPGDLSGIELARRAAEEWPQLKIVLSSGFPGEAEALRDTPWAFLAKPYTPVQLRSIIADTQPS